MADAEIGVTIEAVHTAIIDAIRGAFPDLKTVAAYYPDRRSPAPVPACFIELTEMETPADIDPGTGQLAVQARFEARILIGFRQGQNAKLEIRKLAAAFAAFARLNRWGLKGAVGPAEVIGCYPDDFAPEQEQYECWRIDWSQVIHLGESVWKNEGTTPALLYSWAPETGAAHEPDYLPIERLGAL